MHWAFGDFTNDVFESQRSNTLFLFRRRELCRLGRYPEAVLKFSSSTRDVASTP
jgi:hypothetical protein